MDLNVFFGFFFNKLPSETFWPNNYYLQISLFFGYYRITGTIWVHYDPLYSLEEQELITSNSFKSNWTSIISATNDNIIIWYLTIAQYATSTSSFLWQTCDLDRQIDRRHLVLWVPEVMRSDHIWRRGWKRRGALQVSNYINSCTTVVVSCQSQSSHALRCRLLYHLNIILYWRKKQFYIGFTFQTLFYLCWASSINVHNFLWMSARTQ